MLKNLPFSSKNNVIFSLPILRKTVSKAIDNERARKVLLPREELRRHQQRRHQERQPYKRFWRERIEGKRNKRNWFMKPLFSYLTFSDVYWSKGRVGFMAHIEFIQLEIRPLTLAFSCHSPRRPSRIRPARARQTPQKAVARKRPRPNTRRKCWRRRYPTLPISPSAPSPPSDHSHSQNMSFWI